MVSRIIYVKRKYGFVMMTNTPSLLLFGFWVEPEKMEIPTFLESFQPLFFHLIFTLSVSTSIDNTTTIRDSMLLLSHFHPLNWRKS